MSAPSRVSTGTQVYQNLAGAAAVAAPTLNAPVASSTGGTSTALVNYYKVTAVNAAGETVGSNEVSATPPTLLAAPTLTLGATGATGGTFAAGTYYWKVTALNASGETVGSNEVSATVALNGTQALSWAAVTGATSYKVYRATAAGGESTSPALVTSTTSTSYTDTGTATTAGAVPASNTTGGTTNSYALSWSAPAGAASYRVYRSATAGGESTSPALIGTPTAPSFTDTGAAATTGAVPASNTATPIGATIDLVFAHSSLTMQTVVAGAPASINAVLEGSLDSVNFTTLATSTSVTGDYQFSTGKPVRYVRARVTAIAGGTNPTVNAFVCATP